MVDLRLWGLDRRKRLSHIGCGAGGFCLLRGDARGRRKAGLEECFEFHDVAVLNYVLFAFGA
jgi:hypothetical protein